MPPSAGLTSLTATGPLAQPRIVGLAEGSTHTDRSRQRGTRLRRGAPAAGTGRVVPPACCWLAWPARLLRGLPLRLPSDASHPPIPPPRPPAPPAVAKGAAANMRRFRHLLRQQVCWYVHRLRQGSRQEGAFLGAEQLGSAPATVRHLKHLLAKYSRQPPVSWAAPPSQPAVALTSGKLFCTAPLKGRQVLAAPLLPQVAGRAAAAGSSPACTPPLLLCGSAPFAMDAGAACGPFWNATVSAVGGAGPVGGRPLPDQKQGAALHSIQGSNDNRMRARKPTRELRRRRRHALLHRSQACPVFPFGKYCDLQFIFCQRTPLWRLDL